MMSEQNLDVKDSCQEAELSVSSQRIMRIHADLSEEDYVSSQKVMRIHADLSEEDYVPSQKVMPIDADLSEEDNVSSQWLIQEPTDEDVSEEEGETGPAQKVQPEEAVLCSLGEPSEAKVLSWCQCNTMVENQVQMMQLTIQELQKLIKDILAKLESADSHIDY